MGMAELDRSVDFDYNSVEMTDRLIQCAQHALPYFSTQVGTLLILSGTVPESVTI
jgi:hypothetical protein